MFSSWYRLALETSMLALESQQVIALRMMKMSVGGSPSQKEARLMVSEKAQAAGETALQLASGGSAQKIVRNYRSKVRANRRRLTRTG